LQNWKTLFKILIQFNALYIMAQLSLYTKDIPFWQNPAMGR